MTAALRHAGSVRAVIIALALTIACSGASESQTPIGPTPVPTPDGWLTYTDAAHGFSIGYPPEFVILPESTSPRSGVVKRVRFQHKQIASSEFVDREPERMLIEVFTWTQPAALETWLRSMDAVPPDAELSSFTWPGAREGVSVRRQAAVSPNEFYYLSTNARVYALTPSGDGSEMLGTFKLLP